jgi:hypothetical protein
MAVIHRLRGIPTRDWWEQAARVFRAKREFIMDKRYLKAMAVVLGAFTGAPTIGGISASPAYGQTSVAPAGVSLCVAVDVNDAGTAVGTCYAGADVPFVRLPTASTSTVLASASQACQAFKIGNAQAGREIIIGWCASSRYADRRGVNQGAYWTSANPTTAPTTLLPLSLLGLDPDVQTKPQAVNASGVIVGVSLTANGTPTPVSWALDGVATQLATPLLAPKMRCGVTGINDAQTPSIIGDCSDYSDAYSTKAVALLWQGTTSAYATLPVPTSYKFCNVISVNLAGQIFGRCFYQGYNAVVWGPGGTGPVIMKTIGGNANAANTVQASGGINDNGVVACNYKTGGLTMTCRWDPSNGSTDGVAISIPAGGTGSAAAFAIGNNGKIIGEYSMRGLTLPFSVESGSTVAIGGGNPAGGPEVQVRSMSKSGVNEGLLAQSVNEFPLSYVLTVP